MTITQCRVCGSGKIKTFFDLGNQPPSNSLLHSSTDPETFYPLSLARCADCALVQLTYTVNPKELFSHYVWVTGTAKGTQEFSKVFCEKLLARAGNGKHGYVLEIASNDGTFLKPFMEKGYRVLGIDPAENIVEMAEKEGIPTTCAFWGSEEAKKTVEKKGKARIIFARNVLPHVAETNDFTEGLNIALEDEGVLAIEAHYAKVILEGLHYDSIYHEHLCYFTLKTLETLLGKHGLYAFDIDTSPISGGGIIVYAKKTKGEESEALASYRAEEEKEEVNTEKRWEEFTERAKEHKKEFLRILREATQSGGRLIGWGASARSSTLLNFAGVNIATLPMIIDLNPLKQGKYTAGTHISIVSAEEGMGARPTHVCITAWNFAEEIRETLKNTYGFKGTCVIPLPKNPRVIS